jgi:DNA-binding IclR family transcriptional regulator
MPSNSVPWALDELEALQDMLAAGKLSVPEIAKRLDRTPGSVHGKLAGLRESKWSRKSSRPNYVKATQRNCQAAYQAPSPRRNDCRKHLTLILKAHGRGYPVCGRAA